MAVTDVTVSLNHEMHVKDRIVHCSDLSSTLDIVAAFIQDAGQMTSNCSVRPLVAEFCTYMLI